MDQGFLKGFVRIGFFVGGGGLILLLLEPRNSPEWVISLCSVMIGAALIIVALIVSRLLK
jgi:hypothetical protein